MKTINDIKTRSRRPKVKDPVTEYSTVKDVTDVIVSVDSYFDDQVTAYTDLQELRKLTDDSNIVLVSGIVEKAEDIQSDIEWASETLESVFTHKKNLYEKNRDHFLQYEFKTFTKPTLKG
ncbi:MAG: hypothetical protein H8E85_00590 [Candidatus Marinimicrobia bacterium]|nr:hypothetical protein [Candidatus Neomarinimicrobiota bacterium]